MVGWIGIYFVLNSSALLCIEVRLFNLLMNWHSYNKICYDISMH
jgi:hypothetical protein